MKNTHIGDISTPGVNAALFGPMEGTGIGQTQTPGIGPIRTSAIGLMVGTGIGQEQNPGFGETQTPGFGQTQTPCVINIFGNTDHPGIIGDTDHPFEGGTELPGCSGSELDA
jgi:hypothetical protein